MRDIDLTLTLCHQKAASQLSETGSGIFTLGGKNRAVGFCSSYDFDRPSGADQYASFFALTSAMINTAPCVLSGRPDHPSPRDSKGSLFRQSSGAFLSDCRMILVLSALPASKDVIQICSPILPVPGKLFGCITRTVTRELSAEFREGITLNRYFGMQHPDSLPGYYTHRFNVPAVELGINAQCLESECFWVSLNHALHGIQDGIEILFTMTRKAA